MAEPTARLFEVLATYYDAPEPPDRDAFLAAHPELAEALAEHFAEQDRLSALASPLRSVRAGDEPTRPISGEPTRPAVGDVVRYFGDYELRREIARGGMGIVFEARQISLNRPVALKLILTGVLASDEDRRRFRLEAEAAASLDHPHIVPIHEVGEHQGFSYFSMKLIPGGSLASRLGEFGGHPRDAARVVAAIARAVHHAHQRGILHRDLKPSNVLLDADDTPHVVDFGLAKRVGLEGGELTASGAVIGTPQYMAPEQASPRRGGITTATDVHGLGAILYAMLVGRAPFGGDSVVETLDQVRNREPEPPSRVGRPVNRDLETICLKCLAKQPARRYDSALAVAEDLERWLRGEPIAARRVRWVERAWLWARRRPAVAVLSAATILAVLIGTAAVFTKNIELAATNKLLAHQRSRARDREQQAIDAVKRFRDAVADEPLLRDSPELEQLRKRLLREPLAFFKSLRDQLQADSDTRPEALSRLASAAFDLGYLTREIGDEQDAITAYRQSLDIYQKLAADHPTGTDYQSDLAASHNDLGALLRETGALAEARRAFEAAREIRWKLARDHPSVAAYQSDLAASHNNLGALLHDTGALAEARRAYEAAREIWQRLARDHPGVTDYQSRLAASHNNLGNLLHDTGAPAEARRAYEAAREIRWKLARDHPSVAAYQSDLAASHNNLGLLLRKTGAPAEARRAFEAAREIRWKLARDHPSVAAYQSDLARSHNNLGNLLHDTGAPAEARRAHEAALEIWQRLARDHPTVAAYQRDLAASHNNLGVLLRETGAWAEARRAYEAALEIWQRLTRDRPDVADYSSSLGSALGNLALIDIVDRRFAEARDRLREAIVHQKKAFASNPNHPAYRRPLADHLALLTHVCSALGDVETLAQTYAELEELAAQVSNPGLAEIASRAADGLMIGLISRARDGMPEDVLKRLTSLLDRAETLSAQNRYNLACALAVCAEEFQKAPDGESSECVQRVEELVARAVELLRSAHASGFFAEARNRSLLRDDADLNALRSRADFRALVRDVLMPTGADAFARAEP
jgi:tetratricopeptide (TPR) repeat protein